MRGGPPQSGLSLVSLGGHGLSTPLFSAGQVGSARKGSGFFACSTPGGVGGQDGLRRVGRPSFATRPAGKCRTVATSDAGFFRRAWVVNSVVFGWPGGKRSEGFRLLCVLNARGVGGQDGLRRVGRPSFATRPAGKCRTVATSDAGSSNPRPLPGASFRLVGGTRGFCLCASLKLRSAPPFGSCRTTGSQFRRSTSGA